MAALRDDIREVRKYITALDHGIRRLGEGFPLSMRLLREVHEQLMLGVRGGAAAPGEFRTTQNWIVRHVAVGCCLCPAPRRRDGTCTR